MSSAPRPEGYPGNLSLPAEVREKILSTFRHTLDLYRDGKLDDCLIGCDFILKMDPRFAPARKLQEKARNPRSEVDLSELEAASGGPAPAAAAPPPRESRATAPPVGSPGAAAPAVSREPLPPAPGAVGAAAGGLDDLSLDALSLDGPLPDLSAAGSGDGRLPFAPSVGADAQIESPFADLAQGPMAEDPALARFEDPSPEHQIAALLKQGDDARAAGDPQQAIEIWSRIFLIDINHAEAVARIEKARAEMAEESRALASALGEDEDIFAKGDPAAARGPSAPASFPDARPRTTGAVAGAAPGDAPSPHDLSAVATPADVLAEEMDQSGPPGRRSWSLPRPTRESLPAVETVSDEGAKRLRLLLNPKTAAIAGAVVLLLVAGLFLLTRSSGAKTEVATPETGPSLERATSLFRQGKIAETAEELKRIPEGHPDYAQAQKLLASLAAPGAGPSRAASDAPVAAAPAPSQSSDAAALRAEAERALAERRYIDALKSFSLAAPHFSADTAFARQMAEASERVRELTPAVKLYNDAEYETAIPILWRIYQASRDNQDARSYLLRSYYNQGIGQIQNGLYDRALESFGEVLSLDPQDVDAARHRRFAERYRDRELDLLGRIYLRYISPRP